MNRHYSQKIQIIYLQWMSNPFSFFSFEKKHDHDPDLTLEII